MPTYLIHGFRWLRHSIRIHIILNDLEDAAAEWIVAPATSITLLTSFYKNFDFLPPLKVPAPPHGVPGMPREQGKSDYGNDVGRNEDNGYRKDSENENGKEKGVAKGDGFKKKLKKMGSKRFLRGNGNGNGNGNGVNHVGEDARAKGVVSNHKTNTSTTTVTTSASSRVEGLKAKTQFAFNDLSPVKLLEQHDPDNLEVVSQPFAYVADYVIKIDLAASLTEEIARYEAMENTPLKTFSKSRAAGSAPGKTNGVAKPSTTTHAQGRSAKRTAWIEKLRDGLEKEAELGWFVVVCGDEERDAPDDSDGASEITLESLPTDPQMTPTKKGMRRFFSRKNMREA